jgi:hypothetical protein
MKKKNFIIAAIILGALCVSTSCNKQLDRPPIVGQSPSNTYNNVSSITQVLAKLYGGLSLSGSSASACDLGSFDAGTSVMYRMFWCCEELPTDEAKIAWNDGNLPDLNTNTWNSNNDKLAIIYDRIFYEIGICNEFIRELPDSKINTFSASDAATIKNYVAEARFLRAFSYWLAIDFFGNVPFTTEATAVGTAAPPQIQRAALFNYVTSELRAIDGSLIAPGTVMGRADQGAEWTLLAKLYLNAQVYTGTAKYDSAIIYCQKVTSSSYALASNYANLFKIDNITNADTKSEIIFPLLANGISTQSYGNSTFLICASYGAQPAANFGMQVTGWGGYRATSTFVALFDSTDKRYLFDTAGQTLAMPTVLNFPNGYAYAKFKNVSSTGEAGSNGTFADLSIPLFRLADVYLMYAEAEIRLGGGAGPALADFNLVRERAGLADISNPQLSDILNERGREMYCEGTRRTDLIRFSEFSGSTYVWPWKGGTPNGTSIDAHYNLFPITSIDLNANPNLKQNPGYN